MLWPRLLQSSDPDVIDPAQLRSALVLYRQSPAEVTQLQIRDALRLFGDGETDEMAALLATMPAAQLDRVEWTDHVIALVWTGRTGQAGFDEASIKSILGIA